MCPHGYHHNGFMATPALGTQEVRFIYIYIYAIFPVEWGYAICAICAICPVEWGEISTKQSVGKCKQINF